MPDFSRATRVAVVDDHDVIRTGVSVWCARAVPPIEVVGEYADAEDFLTAHPDPFGLDVVVLDLELPSRRPDFSTVEKVAVAGHRVLVYSHIEQDEVIMSCLERGAITYIAKSEGEQHLLAAIRDAGVDRAYVGPRMAAALNNDRRVGRPRLSPRERQVLLAWFQTESKELVARQLYMSAGSVKTYLQRVRAKYAAVGRAAPTKAALVARAVQDGIISVDDL